MKVQIFIIIVLALAFARCADDNNDITLLNIIRSDVEFLAAGGNGEIKVSSSAAITASSNKSWLTIKESADASSVRYSVATNTDISARTATITITADDRSEEIHIVQKGATFTIVEEVSMIAAASTVYVDYATNAGISPSVTSIGDESWLSVSVEDGKLVCTTLSNTVLERSSSITVALGWKTQEIKVTQRGIVDDTSVILFNGSVRSSGVVALDESVLSSEYTIKTSDSWIRYSVTGGKLVINANAENSAGTPRSGTIMVTAFGVTATIDVTQYYTTCYQFYLGTWRMNYEFSTMVTLEEYVAGSSYVMRGLLYAFEVLLDETSGNLIIFTQEVAHHPSYSYFVYLSLLDYNTNYITRSKGVGFNLIFNEDVYNPVLSVKDNGVWKTDVANSIVFAVYQDDGKLSGEMGHYYLIDSFSR